jgi:hypothetical protein
MWQKKSSARCTSDPFTRLWIHLPAAAQAARPTLRFARAVDVCGPAVPGFLLQALPRYSIADV